jgi:hypothetical protein
MILLRYNLESGRLDLWTSIYGWYPLHQTNTSENHTVRLAKYEDTWCEPCCEGNVDSVWDALLNGPIPGSHPFLPKKTDKAAIFARRVQDEFRSKGL